MHTSGNVDCVNQDSPAGSNGIVEAIASFRTRMSIHLVIVARIVPHQGLAGGLNLSTSPGHRGSTELGTPSTNTLLVYPDVQATTMVVRARSGES